MPFLFESRVFEVGILVIWIYKGEKVNKKGQVKQDRGVAIPQYAQHHEHKERTTEWQRLYMYRDP
jgi:hypothetical protein